jgi:hypothetical protein
LKLREHSGKSARDPSRSRIEAAVLSLPRDGHLGLEHSGVDKADEYIQVWLRPDGIYQLEYRDGSPTEHYQTLTVSADKVHTAFNAWRLGDREWRAGFTWTCIGSMFD